MSYNVTKFKMWPYIVEYSVMHVDGVRYYKVGNRCDKEDLEFGNGGREKKIACM